MKDYKVMFIGCSGSGKTSAILSVSEIEPILTDVINTDRGNYPKDVTTVGLDYGEVTLPGQRNGKMRLYGTPGQPRFSFMWDILGRGTIGIILLADNSRSDPIAETRCYLSAFKEKLRDRAGVGILGIVKADIHPYPDKEAYQRLLREMEIEIPVVTVDARDRGSVLLMLKILSRHLQKNISQGDIEAKNDELI